MPKEKVSDQYDVKLLTFAALANTELSGQKQIKHEHNVPDIQR